MTPVVILQMRQADGQFILMHHSACCQRPNIVSRELGVISAMRLPGPALLTLTLLNKIGTREEERSITFLTIQDTRYFRERPKGPVDGNSTNWLQLVTARV